MITFDYLTLKAFFEENKSFFEGARLQKIQQPTRREFLFTIRGDKTRKLYVNIDPQTFHICFTSDKTLESRNITIPKKPPMFCMLLRKHIEGFRITKVNVPPYERIFEIYFESYNELNEKIELCVAIELMGKYSNMILYNCDTGIIIGCAHNVGAEKSRERELSGTLPYIYPKQQNKSDILKYFGLLDYDTLNDNFFGISKSFQKLLKSSNVPLEKIKDYIELKTPLTPAISDEDFCIYSELLANDKFGKTVYRYDNVNDMIDNYFSAQQERILKQNLRVKLKNTIYPLIKKQALLIDKLSNQLQKKDNSSKYKHYADMIMTNLFNNSDYTQSINIVDWGTNKTITIPLDKQLTLKENAQKYYKMYSKSKNSVERLQNLKEEAKVLHNYLQEIYYSIETAECLTDLLEIESECEEYKFIKQKSEYQKNNSINISETEIDGFKIYIGKNNKQNDYIVSKLASAQDLWFHTQNCTGSHILMKITDNREPDEKAIYECCKLAKKYSSARNSTKTGVIYTRRKYLKKPPKTHLGYVTYKNEKEIIVSEKG